MNVLKIKHSINNIRIKQIVSEKIRYFYPDIKGLKWSEETLLLTIEKKLKPDEINKIKKDVTHFIESNKRIERFLLQDASLSGNQLKKQAVFRDKILKELKILFSNFSLTEQSQKSIFYSSTGVIMYSNEVMEFRDSLNKAISKLGKHFFNTESFQTPSLLNRNIAKKSGYFNIGSQHMYYVNELVKDTSTFGNYDELLRNSEDFDININKFVQPSEFILNPAVCLHIYPKLEGIDFSSEEEYRAFDLVGSAFRDEGGNINNQNRFREFCVHELVFFASEENVKELYNGVLNFMIAFLDTLKILQDVEYSNDIFFGNQADSQLVSQAVGKDKIEAIGSSGISIASLNLHKDKFTKAFKITQKSERIHSFCLAFGIDRIISEILLNNKK